VILNLNRVIIRYFITFSISLCLESRIRSAMTLSCCLLKYIESSNITSKCLSHTHTIDFTIQTISPTNVTRSTTKPQHRVTSTLSKIQNRINNMVVTAMPINGQVVEARDFIENGNKCSRCGKNFTGINNACSCDSQPRIVNVLSVNAVPVFAMLVHRHVTEPAELVDDDNVCSQCGKNFSGAASTCDC